MCPGGEGEAEAVMVEGVDQPFAVVESAISFIWTLSEYCQLLDQLPLGKEAGRSPFELFTKISEYRNVLTRGPPELFQHFRISARALHVLNLIWFG